MVFDRQKMALRTKVLTGYLASKPFGERCNSDARGSMVTKGANSNRSRLGLLHVGEYALEDASIGRFTESDGCLCHDGSSQKTAVDEIDSISKCCGENEMANLDL